MAEDSEFRKIWANAFDIYKAETHRDIKDDPVLQNLNSTEDLLAQINDQTQKFGNFRAENETLWTVLSVIMKPVELLGGLAQDTLTLTPFSPCSQVLGAVLYLVKAAKGVSSAYDCITGLLKQLKAFTDRLQEYTKATVDSKLQKTATEILATLLVIFARSENLIRQGRIKHYVTVTFLGSNEKVAAAMNHLKELVDAEEKLVIALNYSTTQRIDKNMGSLIESQKESKEQAEKKKGEAEQKLINECLYSKEAMTGISEIHERVLKQRLEPSGEWIKEEPLFQNWRAKETPVLWILGNPGSGKSYLSSRIISYLRELYPQDSKHPSRVSVGYFYVKEDNQYLRSLATILKSLAFQVQGNDSVYKNYVANVCNSPEKILTARSLWKRCFKDFFGSLQYRDSSAFLVIDGLDEAPRHERETLMELLEDLEDVSGQNVRPRIQIVLVGRHELHDDINMFWGKNIEYVDVSASKNSKDITNYIAKGLKSIKYKSRPSDISKALDSAPPDVSAMIRHVFERLSGDPDVGEDLNEMLLWVTCARRPLSLGEIHAIMKLRSSIGEDLPDLEELLRIKFASFFILERKDKRTTEELLRPARNTYAKQILSAEEENVDSDDLDGDLHSSASFDSDLETTIVKFSHASIRDYLVQEGTPEKSKYSKIKIGFDISLAEQHIAATCLSILCSKDTKAFDEPTSLAEYAADHFKEHLVLFNKSTMSQKDRQMILRPLFLLFSDESIIKTWLPKISDFVQIWFKNTKFSACVRDWFGQEDAFGDDFTSEERAAMQKMAQSDKELFRPLASYCASTWLEREGGSIDLSESIPILRGYVTIVSFALLRSRLILSSAIRRLCWIATYRKLCASYSTSIRLLQKI
ncbi:hypothetical protein MMC07_004224 [Pseudocyphellaria aurata]|nr:hypothetical protein [Pseudocyphellaria aurata]